MLCHDLIKRLKQLSKFYQIHGGFMKVKAVVWHVSLLCMGASLLGCQQASALTGAQIIPGSTLFTEQHQAIKLENKNRRKWDNALISDLDQDGYPDLLLTDHGYTIRLYWNNKGVYDKGRDLIVGDMHGIGVGDYDKDGKMDILLSRGGGSGSNARNAKLFHFNKREIIEGGEFSPKLPTLRGRTSKFFDANNNGHLDLLLMGFPQANSGKQTSNFIYKNDGTGNITHATDLPKTNRDGQKVLITDFNNDKIDDLVIYGDGALRVLKGNGDFTFSDVTANVLRDKIMNATGVSEVDFDNDGDFDLYISRANPLQAGDTFFDAKSHTFGFYTKRGPFKFDDLLIGDTLNLVNYQSPYPNQDVFVGEGAYKYKFEGERHSGKNINIVSSNGLGWPDTQPNKGLYVGYIGNNKWRMAGNTFSPTTGVVTDVKHYTVNKKPIAPSDLLLKNNDGKFVDVSAKAGIKTNLNTTGVSVGDFDNNGYQDLFVVKQGNLVTPTSQILYFNNGDNTFSQATHSGLITNTLGTIGSGANVLDYNLDGQVDIIMNNDRGQWHLFSNQANNSNHYALLRISNSLKHNASAIRAIATLKACGKTLTRRVSPDAAPYTQSFNNVVHFGLGQCNEIDSVSLRYSNGEVISTTKVRVDSVINL